MGRVASKHLKYVIGIGRIGIRKKLDEIRGPVLVRINGVETPWHEADLELLQLPNLGGVMLPKTEGSPLNWKNSCQLEEQCCLLRKP